MKSVKEVSQLSGVSVRTLHYYDEIDLLKPSVVAENGYRYYNRDAVVRLQEILLYRELDFPLKKIKEIVGQPGYDKVQALRAEKVPFRSRHSSCQGLTNGGRRNVI